MIIIDILVVVVVVVKVITLGPFLFKNNGVRYLCACNWAVFHPSSDLATHS